MNKTKTSRRLPCFLIEFMASVEKLGCAQSLLNNDKIWKSIRKFIKSSSNELILGTSSLHDPLCKLFFEQLFDDFMALTIYIFCNS